MACGWVWGDDVDVTEKLTDLENEACCCKLSSLLAISCICDCLSALTAGDCQKTGRRGNTSSFANKLV